MLKSCARAEELSLPTPVVQGDPEGGSSSSSEIPFCQVLSVMYRSKVLGKSMEELVQTYGFPLGPGAAWYHLQVASPLSRVSWCYNYWPEDVT